MSDPTSSVVVKHRTSRSEKRRSTGGPGSPASRWNSACSCRIHSSTLGRSRSERASSADVVADVTHGTPARRAATGPARACWSAITTSGRNSSMACSTPGSMARPRGRTNSCQKNLRATTPFSSCQSERSWARSASSWSSEARKTREPGTRSDRRAWS